MPLQVLPVVNQPDGLAMLGDVIGAGARDYEQRTRQLADEDRRRGQQLADIASARSWQHEENVSSDDRRLAQEKALQEIRTQEDIKRTLISEGLLAPGDINDQAKVSAAFELARQRGLDQLYAELTSTPDENGKPILSRDDFGNPAAISAAKTKLGQMKAAKLAFTDSQAKNAQTELGRIASQINQVQGAAAALDQKLGAPAPALSQDELTSAAIQIAGAAHPGKPPSNQEIAAAMPQAKQQLEQAAVQKWMMDKQDAQVQRGVLASQLQDLRYQYDTLVNKFNVAPVPGSMGAPAAGAPLANPVTEASPQQRAAAAAALIPPKPPGGPGAPSLLANPTNDPIITAANDRRGAASWQANLADPYTQTLDKLQELQTRKHSILQGVLPDAYTSGLITAKTGQLPAPLSPDEKAKLLSDTLVEEQSLMRQADQTKRAMLGLSPTQLLANPMLPQQNNSSGYTPRATYKSPASNLNDVQSFDFENTGP